MAVFKCKMCGGTIEFEQGASVGVCDSCGTKQTLPKLDDDRRANLYDRANHFRRNNEFDKAAGIYEQILNEDRTDAEAYWSLVLCRYGIEYVEDPATKKRVPTVNRAQFTSVFDDDNYKSAIRYAGIEQKLLYEEEAKQINEIQKGILAISQKEEPFDVFICYKETDNNGRRTPDSVLANDLYHQLTQEGFKVFFARITLEDKLGTAYEPYIFAALNSAKVMVALGTKPEYFNAVWVKNEWSRYLALVKQSGGKKVLIPAYKDMDPYDLPEEFSHLQAQDMGKLGFMQDLIRGIKKLTATPEPKAAVHETVVVNSAAGANAAPLLKRAFMFLEDGDWNSANEYCEKVLDLDPENGQAYLGKLMAELKVKKKEDLASLTDSFKDRNNYQKALRFGDEKLKEEVRRYELTARYNAAEMKMRSSATEADYRAAWASFKEIAGFRDADAQVKACEKRIKEIETKEEHERQERNRREEEERITAENAAEVARRKAKCTVTILVVLAILAIVGWYVYNNVIVPQQNYNAAIALYNKGEYGKAISAFKALNGYKDSVTWITACETARKDHGYANAVSLYNDGKYEEAISVFKSLNGYKDSTAQITSCETAIKNRDYAAAVALMDAYKYEEAIKTFKALNGYKDSVAKIITCETAIKDRDYAAAVALMDAKKYEEAIKAFQALNGYKDSAKKLETAKTLAAKVGDVIKFGMYEQDNRIVNGKEDIQWIVLAKQGSKLLLISRYGLDCKAYDSSRNTIVTWETCTLRTWLNETFLNEAFSSAEQKQIVTTTVSADKNPKYSTDPGNATQDKVFLLSIPEANKYFTFNSDLSCRGTEYAYARGAKEYDYHGCWWWLRSPGIDQSNAAGVINQYLEYTYDYFKVYRDNVAVRPALWIDLGL